ncbi:MAG: histidine kinase [Saprospiraceae bacterium]|nr:histidine kinase [Saprospiraceae bacterium]
MNARAIFLLYSLFLIFQSPVHCQPFSSTLFTISDGLPSNYIFNIYQDHAGYLWVGTSNGLSRFDGVDFKNYNVSHGLPSVFVDRTYEDSKGRLWIGTRSGICELRGDSCHFTPVNDGRKIAFVSGFYEDDGQLISLTNQGAYVLDHNIWNKIPLMPGFENNLINGVVKQGSNLYFNYENKIIAKRDSLNIWKVIDEKKMEGSYYNRFVQNKGGLYVSRYHGLDQIVNDQLIPIAADSLISKLIYGSFGDTDGKIWLTLGEDGILIMSGLQVAPFFSHFKVDAKFISSVFHDRDGQTWVSTDVGILRLQEASFQQFDVELSQLTSPIRNLISLDGNRFFLSLESGDGLLVDISPGENSKLDISDRIHLGDFIDQSIHHSGIYWMVSRDGQLLGLQGSTPASNEQLVRIAGLKNVRHLAISPKTDKWFISTQSVVLSRNENMLDTLKDPESGQFIRDGAELLCTSKGILIGYSYLDGAFMINHDEKIVNVSDNLNLHQMEFGVQFREDREGSIWMTKAGAGLFKYKLLNDTAIQDQQHLTDREGLPDNQINDFCFDRNNNLWVLTNQTISVFKETDKLQWIHQIIPIDQSIKPADLQYSKLIQDNDGNVWIFGSKVLLKLNQVDFNKINLPPKIVFEKISLFTKSSWTDYTDSLLGYMALPENPLIPYHENSLQIGFKGIQLANASPKRYAYRLLPATDTWTDGGKENTVSFYRLDPGQYRFEVKVQNPGLPWSEPINYDFEIDTPFWLSKWFYLMVVLSGSGILIFTFQQRIKQIRTQEQFKLKVKDLELNALKVQMNPHFIYNALNSIQSLIVQTKNDEARNYIQKFARLLRQVLQFSGKELISLQQELSSVFLYLDIEMLRMGDEIIIQREIDPDLQQDEILIPPSILQPFVENALWHGLNNKEGLKKLYLVISKSGDWLKIIISDNGIGRTKAGHINSISSDDHLSMAVASITERLKLYNQDPQVGSVSYIDLYEDGIASGTTVTILVRLFE